MLAYVSTLSPSVRNKAQNMGGMGRDQRLLTFSLSTLVLAGEEEELAYLVERLDKTSTAYGVEISAKQTKLITKSISGMNKEIKVNGQKLGTVTSFKYLGLVITDEGSKPEILSRRHRQQPN